MNTMHKMKSIFGPVVTKKNLYSESSEDIPGEFFCTRGGGSRQRRRLPIDAITLKPVSAPAYKDPVTKRSLTLKTLREWVKTNPSDPLTRRAYSQEELGIINGTEAYTYDREHGWEWSEVWLAPEIDRFVCKMVHEENELCRWAYMEISTSNNVVEIFSYDEAVECVAFGPAGAACAAWTSVYFWSPHGRARPRSFDGIRCISFSGDNRLVTGTAQGVVHVYETQPPNLDRPFVPLYEVRLGVRPVRSLQCVDSILLAETDRATVIDITNRLILATWAGASTMCFSPDGSLIGTAHDRGAVVIRHARTGEAAHRLRMRLHTPTEHAVLSLSFSLDGQRLVGTSPGRPCQVTVWDVATGREIFCFADGAWGHDMHAAIFAGTNDNYIVTAAPGASNVVVLHSAADGSEVEEHVLTDARCVVAFGHRGGKLLIIGSDGTLMSYTGL